MAHTECFTDVHDKKYRSVVTSSADKLLRLGVTDESGWFDRYLQMHRDSIRFQQDVLLADRYLPGGGSVCEIGAAPFLLSQALSDVGFTVTALDISPERFKGIERSGLKIRKCNIDSDTIPCDDASFDGVTMNALFEHLRGNLIRTVSEIHRVLKPDGLFFLFTPNLRNWKGVFNFLFRGITYTSAGNLHHEWSKLETIGHMGHVREYTPREVADFLEANGFEVQHILFRGDIKPQKLGKFRYFYYLLRLLPLPHFRKTSFSIVAKKVCKASN